MRACTKQSVIKDKRIRREKMSGFRSRQCLESSQNATALAAATFKESTPCAIGIMILFAEITANPGNRLA